MGSRGKQSVAEMSVASIEVQAGRVRPPADLPEPCQKIWRELVDSLPGNRFHRSDVPLLALYVRALNQATLAFAKLEQFGAAHGDKQSPWLKVCDSATKAAGMLASRLRLCPSSRLDRKTIGPSARSDASADAPWPRECEMTKEE